MATNCQPLPRRAPARWPAWFFCSLFLAVLWAHPALGHAPDETYLTLTLAGSQLSGQWDVPVRDLQQALSSDPRRGSSDRPLVASVDLERRLEALALDTVGRLEIKADGRLLELRVTDHLTVTLNNGPYARVLFVTPPLRGPPAALGLDTRGLFRIDPGLHGLLRLEQGGRTQAVVFNAERPVHEFTLAGNAGRWRQWWTFVGEGIWHIWLGLDHILFLLALLLPAVLRREGVRWAGVDRLRPALLNALGIVTAFTIAHSLTLSLAALGVVRLPPRLVESVIAASVALAALNNLRPWFAGRGWLVAFGFGLVHGFGFANVLTELGLAGGTLALALVGFNIGVEIGQLALVCAFFPLAFGLRHSPWYRTGLFKFGSAAVLVLALIWLVERAFDLRLIPF